MKKFAKNFLAVALAAFVLQYVWEYTVCGMFYVMNANTSNISLMFSATLGDVVMTVALYALLSFVNKDPDWIFKKWQAKEYCIVTLYALFLSFYFEISALYTGRWTYSDAMPLFPNTNVGLIPVLQLVLLFPLTFFITGHIFRHMEKRRYRTLP